MNYLNFDLDDWLYYLENAHQQEIQLGLERVGAVAASMDLLFWDAKIITVAGTNGKGSTVAALESIYIAAGYNVASYTSPHLMAFNERIRVNKESISDKYLCAAFTAIEQARDVVQLTYFEMTTLAALWYFKQCELDIIILEVGMGGRLDATNIVDADLAIITTIALDHQDYLGSTKEAIGTEKAGILRANKPFVYGDYEMPASIMRQARFLNSPTYCLGKEFFFKTSANHIQFSFLIDTLIELPIPRIHPKAATAALVACTLLQSVLPVSQSQLADAMRSVMIYGRQQVVGNKIKTILDVAHNPQAVALLAEFIQQFQSKGKVHAVFSALKDKDICGLIKPMVSCVDCWYPAVLSGKRAASEAFLLGAFGTEKCIVPIFFSSPMAAYHAAINGAKPGDIVVVFGSFLMVSAIMAVNQIEQKELQ